MKKRILSVAGALLVTASVLAFIHEKKVINPEDEFFNANVEALANGEAAPEGSAMDYVCKYLGCCGGKDKCFSGSISIKGVEISGTFYMN